MSALPSTLRHIKLLVKHTHTHMYIYAHKAYEKYCLLNLGSTDLCRANCKIMDYLRSRKRQLAREEPMCKNFGQMVNLRVARLQSEVGTKEISYEKCSNIFLNVFSLSFVGPKDAAKFSPHFPQNFSETNKASAGAGRSKSPLQFQNSESA